MKKIFSFLVLFAVLVSCSKPIVIEGFKPVPGRDVVAGELMVKFASEEAISVEACSAALGVLCEGERIFPVDPNNEERTRADGLHLWYIVRFDESVDLAFAAGTIRGLRCVASVEYNHILHKCYNSRPRGAALPAASSAGQFNDPGLALQWHYINSGELDPAMEHMTAGADAGCEEAWKKCTGDPSIIVAVMDEGVQWSHPDLRANMWVNEDEIYASPVDNDGNGYAGDRYGYNFVGTTGTGAISFDEPTDSGHGTHVAGTIAAVNNNGLGVCGIAGGSGNGDGVKIMSLQIFANNNTVTVFNEARAVKYAADNGAVILQCSWGYISALADPLHYSVLGPRSDEAFEDQYRLEKEAFDYFIYNAGSPDGVIDGGLVIFASGNEFAAMAAYPGAYKSYICVSAIASDFTPASYTNYGRGVDISCPGGDIDYNQDPRGGIYSTLPERFSDGIGYGYMDGTSMACPHMSGIAALGLSYAHQRRLHFNSRQYKDMLLRAVKPINPYLTGEKFYYYAWSVSGEVAATKMDLGGKYYGRMGSGVADAGILLDLIDAEGAPMALPNVFVACGASRALDLALYFDEGVAPDSSLRCTSHQDDATDVPCHASQGSADVSRHADAVAVSRHSDAVGVLRHSDAEHEVRSEESRPYSVTIADPAIATASISGSTLTITATAPGITKYTVTCGGVTKEAWITVRKTSNENGIL